MLPYETVVPCSHLPYPELDLRDVKHEVDREAEPGYSGGCHLVGR
jgi:hypothetical protein